MPRSVWFWTDERGHSSRLMKSHYRAALIAVLDQAGQDALAEFFRSGGVYAGVHAASACLFNDETYKNAVGGEYC